jgi:TonB family protein
LEPVKLELKQSQYFGIYAYGLVNQYGEWVVKPVLPGEEAVVSGDWTIYPCEAKVVDGKVTISQTPVVKFKGEYIDGDNQMVGAPENAANQAEAIDDLKFEVEEVVEQIPEEEIFVTAEQMPTFQGGDISKFRAWVMQHIKYPQIALENGIQGNVIVKFVVEKDGKLSNIQVLQSPDKTLSEAAIQVLQKSPMWKPGKQRNKPVRVAYTLPISFHIKSPTANE